MSYYATTLPGQANGNILPNSLVKGDPSNSFYYLQAGLNDPVIGVAYPGTTTFPDSSLSSTLEAATATQPQFTVYGIGSIVNVQLGAAVTPFQPCKSNASGLAIPANPGENPAVIPFVSGAANDIVECYVVARPNTTSSGLGGVGNLFSATAPATNVASFSTITPITPGMTGEGSLTIPANFFYIGKTLRVTGFGLLATTGTPNYTLTIQLAGVTVAATGAVAQGSGLSNAELYFDCLLQCVATGSSATIQGGGFAVFGAATAAAAATVNGMATTTAANVPTTASAALTVNMTSSASSASNNVTLQYLSIESIG